MEVLPVKGAGKKSGESAQGNALRRGKPGTGDRKFSQAEGVPPPS